MTDVKTSIYLLLGGGGGGMAGLKKQRGKF
jgi:hypothetical protein